VEDRDFFRLISFEYSFPFLTSLELSSSFPQRSYLDKSPSSSSSSSSSSSGITGVTFRSSIFLITPSEFLAFFFFLPKSSYSSSSLTCSLYSTTPLSLKPPPSPVLSSTSVNLGALHMLQVDLLAQFTFPHLVHCQSSAENKPLDFSAAEAPISIPCFLVFSSFFSIPHLLQLDLRAKLTFPH